MLKDLRGALTFAIGMGMFIFVAAFSLGAAFALIRAIWGFQCP